LFQSAESCRVSPCCANLAHLFAGDKKIFACGAVCTPHPTPITHDAHPAIRERRRVFQSGKAQSIDFASGIIDELR
jgi:hypothetical protein